LAAHVAVSVAISVLDGLHYSHELKDAHGLPLEIVHRDVSPQNVFVSNDGQVKVLDFGIAKANSQEGHTATGIVKGKVGYIAPEQARAERVDRRADVWSAGVVLWETLTGMRLFKAETDVATLGLTLQGQIPSAGSRRLGVPQELEAVLLRALQRDPALRYQTAGAMRKDLETWLARAGFSRDGRVIGGLMKDLFASEIIEQQRLVSVLMARSDCTPPAPASHRSPSSTSALYVKVPQSGATSADITRMNDQMADLGKRHRRAFRLLIALLAVFSLLASVTVFLAVTRPRAAAPQPTQVRVAAAGPASLARPHADRAAASEADSNLPHVESARALVMPPASVKKPALVATHALRPSKPSNAAASVALTPSAVNPALPPIFGSLTIDTSPWSIVSLNGRTLGQTPLIAVKLPSGNHVLSLVNPEQGIETSYPVMVESGKTTVRRIGIE
jgi:serine/threonine-protein kinase